MTKIEYLLFYQPEGTVRKNINVNAKTIHEAITKAEEYCKKHNAKLLKLKKITIENIIG